MQYNVCGVDSLISNILILMITLSILIWFSDRFKLTSANSRNIDLLNLKFLSHQFNKSESEQMRWSLCITFFQICETQRRKTKKYIQREGGRSLYFYLNNIFLLQAILLLTHTLLGHLIYIHSSNALTNSQGAY